MTEDHFERNANTVHPPSTGLRALFERFVPPHLRQVIIFLFVGGSVTLGYILVATLIAHLSAWRPAIVSTISWLLMIPIGYTAQRTFVFGKTSSHNTALPRYVATQIIGLTVSSCLSEILVGWLGLPTLIGFGLAGLTTAILSFVLLKFWTFVAQ